MNIIYILIGYYIILGILAFLNLFIILHIVKYKYLGPHYKIILIVYFILIAFIIGFSHLFILKFDWSQQIYFPSVSDFTENFDGNITNQLNNR